MNQVSDRLAALAPSQTLAMSQKSSELKAQGVDVINLSVGEPDFNTPQHIKDAAKKAIDDNFSHYSPVPGYMDLRQAICAKLKNENGLDFTPEQIVVSNGAKQSICNTILALVNPGDEVIQTRRRKKCDCRDGHRTGFQDDTCPTRSRYHAQDQAAHSLFSLQPYRQRLFPRRVGSAGLRFGTPPAGIRHFR